MVDYLPITFILKYMRLYRHRVDMNKITTSTRQLRGKDSLEIRDQIDSTELVGGNQNAISPTNYTPTENYRQREGEA
jgi:hypothetical protein